MSIVHHWNPETLAYVGSSQADESPLEPGVFLVPAHATQVALPESVPADHCAKWDPDAQSWTFAPLPPPLPPIAEEEPAEPPAPPAPVDAMTQLRAYRDRLLAESDWVAIKHFTRSEPYPVEWLVYVQSLRNLPENFTPTLNDDGTLNMASFHLPDKPASA